MGVVDTNEGSLSLRLRLFLPESATLGPPQRRSVSEARFRAVRVPQPR